MLDHSRLREAVHLHSIGYKLFRWIAESIHDGRITFDGAHDWLLTPETTCDWLLRYTALLPDDLLPTDRSRTTMTKLANLLASYLANSLQVVSKPGKRHTSVSPRGCHCPDCTRLVDASHVRPQKITSADRKAAQACKRRAISAIATDVGLSPASHAIEDLLASPDFRERVALVTYGDQLIRRCDGEYDPTAAALALWREIAWTRTGAPKPDFTLTADAVLTAAHDLADELARSAPR